MSYRKKKKKRKPIIDLSTSVNSVLQALRWNCVSTERVFEIEVPKNYGTQEETKHEQKEKKRRRDESR